ncbi:hypothetical protein AVEN_212863-1 [Araneus ventricosus]|uniref:Uncharacterized protein n=1 Tax=Araneus ventricosus TaxID=182803 RepID=A0A4Y2F567_ARAVE|nr:hypothetical protein AVEN_212863-1 [Araneus ventricosus]
MSKMAYFQSKPMHVAHRYQCSIPSHALSSGPFLGFRRASFQVITKEEPQSPAIHRSEKREGPASWYLTITHDKEHHESTSLLAGNSCPLSPKCETSRKIS